MESAIEDAVQYYVERRGTLPLTKEDLIGLISCELVEIDDRLSRQVDAILHHPEFQALEARWRGLVLLVETAGNSGEIRIAVLQLQKEELARDLLTAVEFDQSMFFKKVYEEEFGTAGGQPFGAILSDFSFAKTPSDVELLGKIGEVAASCFAPFIGDACPETFGLSSFEMFERVSAVSPHFEGLRNVNWNSLRAKEDARFLGLTLPRVLLRLPYEDLLWREDTFVFREDVSAIDRSGYLWGSASFAFGKVLVRSFLQNAWFADIRGDSHGPETGGVVDGLPVHSFTTDRADVAIKCSTEAMIGEEREKELSDLGFLPLSDCEDTGFSVFRSTQSLQKPREYDDEAAAVNAQMSAMLQYTLCASRFAHYLKVIARSKVGSIGDAQRFQAYLHSWLQQYVAAAPGASASVRARFPLREARVEVREHPRHPGHYLATFDLCPHFQLDELTASVKLVTSLGGP